jgi:EpsI family protein
MDTQPFSLAENFKEFGVDQEVIREYHDSDDNVIKLYIGYWDFQGQGKELINYKVYKMLDNHQKYKLSQNTIFIYDENEYTKENGKKDDIFIYWIDINGRIIGDKYRAKAYNILDFIKHGRTNSAIVLIKVNKKNGEDIDQTIDRYNNFISNLSAVLKLYFPER